MVNTSIQGGVSKVASRNKDKGVVQLHPGKPAQDLLESKSSRRRPSIGKSNRGVTPDESEDMIVEAATQAAQVQQADATMNNSEQQAPSTPPGISDELKTFGKFMIASLEASIDKRIGTLAVSTKQDVEVLEQRVDVQQQYIKDLDWQRVKALNVKITMTKASSGQFQLTSGMSEADKATKLAAMIQFVKDKTSVSIFEQGCRVVAPTSGSKPFYILQTGSAGEAMHLRTREWQHFKAANLFITEDLTRIQQTNVFEISNLLKAYFGVAFIPSTSFSKDKYKGTLDGDNRKVHLLDIDEVKSHIKSGRLNKPPPKNQTGGTS